MKNVLGAPDVFWEHNFMSFCQNEMLKHPFWQEKDGNVLPLKNEDLTSYFSRFLPALGFYKVVSRKHGGFITVQIKTCPYFKAKASVRALELFLVPRKNMHQNS